MFLRTLAIGEWAVHEWVSKKSDQNNSENSETTEVEKNSKENGTVSRPTKTTEKRKLLLEFFEILPKLES